MATHEQVLRKLEMVFEWRRKRYWTGQEMMRGGMSMAEVLRAIVMRKNLDRGRHLETVGIDGQENISFCGKIHCKSYIEMVLQTT